MKMSYIKYKPIIDYRVLYNVITLEVSPNISAK